MKLHFATTYAGNLPSFTWAGNATEDNITITRLTVDFNDSGPNDQARLVRKPRQYSTTEEQDKQNECILMGYLRDDAKVAVTVAGCPGSTTFQVRVDFKSVSQ